MLYKSLKIKGVFNLEFLDLFFFIKKKCSLEIRVLYFMNVVILSNNDEKMIKKYVNVW